MDRRTFIKATGVAAATSPLISGQASSTIEHVVVVMMENRSFDHFFGWLPGANGQQAGLIFKDSAGVQHPTHYLPPDYQGCAFLDPGHSYTDGRVQYDNGAADGWLFDGSDSSSTNPQQANDIFSIGYYGQADLPFLGTAGPAFTVCDNYFAGVMAETYPNRTVTIVVPYPAGGSVDGVARILAARLTEALGQGFQGPEDREVLGPPLGARLPAQLIKIFLLVTRQNELWTRGCPWHATSISGTNHYGYVLLKRYTSQPRRCRARTQTESLRHIGDCEVIFASTLSSVLGTRL